MHCAASLAFALLVLADQATPQPSGNKTNYERLISAGEGMCFRMLEKLPVEAAAGARLLQSGQTAAKFCGCVGENLATLFLNDQTVEGAVTTMNGAPDKHFTPEFQELTMSVIARCERPAAQ